MFDYTYTYWVTFLTTAILLKVLQRPPNLLLAVFALAITQSVQAEIYKWTDLSGQVHFSDQKPAHLELAPLKLKINTYQSVSYGKSDSPIGNGSSRKVVMYSTDWCGYCKQARNYFKQQSIPFIEYNIEKDSSARAQYDKLGATGVPVILVGKKRMNGFSVNGFQNFYD